MYTLEEVAITLREQQKSQNTRPCHTFQEVALTRPCKLRYVTFQNYYCASVQVQTKQGGARTWEVAVEDQQLMASCFFENDAQQWHTLDTSEWSAGFDHALEVDAIRFVLRQPCPTWRNFGLTEVKCHRLVGSADGNEGGGVTTSLAATARMPQHIGILAEHCGAMQASLKTYREASNAKNGPDS